MYIIVEVHFLEGYRLGAQIIRVQFLSRKEKHFSSPSHPILTVGVHSASHLMGAGGVLSPGVK
jgi:hypothetical protein